MSEAKAKIRIEKKLSVRIILGSKPMVPTDDKGKPLPGVKWLVEAMGIATKVRVGLDQQGEPTTGLQGTFRMMNSETGELAQAGICYLPGVVQNLIEGQLAGEGAKAVEFAFRIGIKYDEKSATNYVYVAEPLMEVSESDPIQLLAAKVSKSAPALAAPKAEGKK